MKTQEELKAVHVRTVRIKDGIRLNTANDLDSLTSLYLLGFGICCTIVLSDGGTTSLNQSYIVQSSSTSLGTGSRQYTICPCSSDVCRIKFDFTVSKI